jgi:4-hydroxymandelate oxidase
MTNALPAPLPATLAQYEALAQLALPSEVWRHLQEGAGQGQEAALASVRLTPRPLGSVRGGHTRLSLLGQSLEHPLLLAPVAYQALFHDDADAGSAMAAAAQGGQSVISSLASQPIEDIVHATRQVQAGDAAAPWFQLYWQSDRDRSLQLLHRAAMAGCSAIVFTVDAPIKRASLQLPAGVRAVNLAPDVPPPAWGPGQSAVFDGWMAQAPTWDDLRWLRHQTTLPLLVKGILHPDDAEAAIDAGCDGIVVSTHGGRVLDGSCSGLDALSAIATRVNARVPLLYDSGVRSGRDAFVAMGLGASAVLVGRPFVWALAAQGALGVAHVIRLMRDELEMTMALMGCRILVDVVGSLRKGVA